MLPILLGEPIRVVVRRSLGSHLAASSIRSRRIELDAAVLTTVGEFERILAHELFHFAWVRLSNEKRRAWELVLACEFEECVAGELGWSAEWRKDQLNRTHVRRRTPRWRRYVCESFCDTGAYVFSGLRAHEEFTLGGQARRSRRSWFQHRLTQGDALPV